MSTLGEFEAEFEAEKKAVAAELIRRQEAMREREKAAGYLLALRQERESVKRDIAALESEPISGKSIRAQIAAEERTGRLLACRLRLEDVDVEIARAEAVFEALPKIAAE